LYFITICTQNRECLFGEIVGANGMRPNENMGVCNGGVCHTPPRHTPVPNGAPVRANGIRPDEQLPNEQLPDNTNGGVCHTPPRHTPPRHTPVPTGTPTMVLSEIGKIVENEWVKSAEIRAEIEIHAYCVMPNHFHAIAEIVAVDTYNDGTPRTGEWYSP
jgi:hypothetical protein